jgi:hypothetical protein
MTTMEGQVGPEVSAAQQMHEQALAQSWDCDEHKIMWGGVIQNGDAYRLNVVNDGGPSSQLDVTPVGGDVVRLEPKSDRVQYVQRRGREDQLSLVEYRIELGCCVLRTYTDPSVD